MFEKQNVEEERVFVVFLASKMVESMKFLVVQACIHEGNEPIQFFSIFQSLILFKGGLSDGYKNYIVEIYSASTGTASFDDTSYGDLVQKTEAIAFW